MKWIGILALALGVLAYGGWLLAKLDRFLGQPPMKPGFAPPPAPAWKGRRRHIRVCQGLASYQKGNCQ